MPTHNIANMGFSGIQRGVARFNFSCNLIGNSPQSLTGHIAKRCVLTYPQLYHEYCKKDGRH